METITKKKLRLLLFEKCLRSCEGCCNKQFDLQNLPQVLLPEEYANYREVILTGGEPLLYPGIVMETIREVRQYSDASIYLYTSCFNKPEIFNCILKLIDGVCVTFHDKEDPLVFKKVLKYIPIDIKRSKSLRLNVFKGIDIWKTYTMLELREWEIKEDIVWINPCPLPENEVFKRLPLDTVRPVDDIV